MITKEQERIFESIYRESEKYQEGLGGYESFAFITGMQQFAMNLPLSHVSPVYWIMAMSGILTASMAPLAVSLGKNDVFGKKFRAVKLWFRKKLSKYFQKDLINIVETVFENHKEEFEGLDGKVALNLLDALVKEEYPEEYKELEKEYIRGLDFMRDEIKKNNFPSKSNKEDLERIKKDFPNVSYSARGYTRRKDS